MKTNPSSKKCFVPCCYQVAKDRGWFVAGKKTIHTSRKSFIHLLSAHSSGHIWKPLQVGGKGLLQCEKQCQHNHFSLLESVGGGWSFTCALHALKHCIGQPRQAPELLQIVMARAVLEEARTPWVSSRQGGCPSQPLHPLFLHAVRAILIPVNSSSTDHKLKILTKKKIWQMVKASLRSSNSVFSTRSWLQINYRVSGICQACHPRVPWTSPPGCLTEQLPTFCITTLHFFLWAPTNIQVLRTSHDPMDVCIQNHGVDSEEFQPEERCNSKLLSMGLGSNSPEL